MVKHVPNILIRLLKYSTVSIFAGVIDLSVILLLIKLNWFHYLISVIFGFFIAHSVNYYINRNWAFVGTRAGHHRSYPLFMGFGALSLFIILPITYFLNESFGISLIFARPIASIGSGIFNFSLNYLLSFGMLEHIRHDFKIHH